MLLFASTPLYVEIPSYQTDDLADDGLATPWDRLGEMYATATADLDGFEPLPAVPIPAFVQLAPKDTPKALSQRQTDTILQTLSTPSMLFRVQQDTRIRFVSKECESVLGFHRSDLAGQTVFSSLHPDDREHFAALLATLESSDHVESVYRRLDCNGNSVVVSARISVFRSEQSCEFSVLETVRGYPGTTIRVVDLAREVYQLKSLVEEHADVIMQVHPETFTILYVSPSCVRWGFNLTDLVGDSLWNFITDDKQAAQSIFTQAGKWETNSSRHVCRHRLAFGTTDLAELSIAAVHDDNRLQHFNVIWRNCMASSYTPENRIAQHKVDQVVSSKTMSRHSSTSSLTSSRPSSRPASRPSSPPRAQKARSPKVRRSSSATTLPISPRSADESPHDTPELGTQEVSLLSVPVSSSLPSEHSSLISPPLSPSLLETALQMQACMPYFSNDEQNDMDNGLYSKHSNASKDEQDLVSLYLYNEPVPGAIADRPCMAVGDVRHTSEFDMTV